MPQSIKVKLYFTVLYCIVLYLNVGGVESKGGIISALTLCSRKTVSVDKSHRKEENQKNKPEDHLFIVTLLVQIYWKT